VQYTENEIVNPDALSNCNINVGELFEGDDKFFENEDIGIAF